MLFYKCDSFNNLKYNNKSGITFMQETCRLDYIIALVSVTSIIFIGIFLIYFWKIRRKKNSKQNNRNGMSENGGITTNHVK